jgi:hypothetical protein
MPAAMFLRPDFPARELRCLAKQSRDNSQSRRLLSLAAVLDGMSRNDAAGFGGMDRPTLRDWVHRFNKAGPDRPLDAWTSGPRPRACHQARRPTSWLSSKPAAAGRRTLSAHLAVLPEETPLEIWFQDEARTGQKNGLVRQWARRGSRPRQPADQRHENAYLFGAICPARGTGAALALPYADTDAMQLHLDEISRHVTRGAHAVLLLDRAGLAHDSQARPPCQHNPDLPAIARA